MKSTEELHSTQFNDEEIEAIDIREIISKYLYHWPVFIIGVLICSFGAFLYLRYTQPVYSVSSTLLIKDEKKGGMPAGGDLLNDLNMFGSSKVVDNEIEILKSKTLMRKVVERLNLSITASAEGHIKSADLYANKPVNFSVIKMNNSYYGTTLTLSFPNLNKYQLRDEITGTTVIGELDKLQRNTYGVFKISRNPNFLKTFNNSFNITINDPINVADQLLSQLNVFLATKQSTVLNLTLQTTVPERGKDIINTLTQVYNEAALIDKNKTTESTIQFINGRLQLITGELTDVEKDVEGFKSSRGLTDISSDANAFLENVKMNDAKLNEINLQISVIKDIQHYVDSNSSHEKMPSTLGIDDPVLLGQITQLRELQLKRDQLLATTTESNPLVVPLAKQIETTRIGIKESIQNIFNSLQASRRDLEGNNAQFQGSIKKIPSQERQLMSIKRQQSIKENLYLYLLQKKEEAALSYASAVADSRVVDPAFLLKQPVSPKRQTVFLIALLTGLLLPFGYVYGKHLINHKIANSKDIEKLTSAPVLGQIMYSEESEAIVVSLNNRSAIAEQFRSIRTNMQFLNGKRIQGKGNVTLFTSSMSGEGKSFVASNLAVAFAQSGKKTILLELDLRKPKVSKYLNLSNKVGLSNYFIGQSNIEDIIVPSGIDDNFHVIGSGPIPPNPAELLSQQEIEALVNHLVKNYDEILIDSPPIGLVTDAQILSRVADVTIYLIRENTTYKNQVRNLEKLYQTHKFPRVNIILNGIKLGGASGYYGYGYGYYSDDIKRNKFKLKTVFNDLLKRL